MARIPHISVMMLAKIWYFFSAGSTVFLIPYLYVFFSAAGYQDRQLGLISVLRPWLSALANMLLPALADRMHCHRVLLISIFAASVALRLTLFWAVSHFLLLLAVVLSADFMASPVGSVTDALVVAASANHGGYGKQRMWASIGWGGLSSVGGILLDKYGFGASFVVYGIMSLPCVLAILNFDYAGINQGSRHGSPAKSQGTPGTDRSCRRCGGPKGPSPPSGRSGPRCGGDSAKGPRPSVTGLRPSPLGPGASPQPQHLHQHAPCGPYPLALGLAFDQAASGPLDQHQAAAQRSTGQGAGAAGPTTTLQAACQQAPKATGSRSSSSSSLSPFALLADMPFDGVPYTSSAGPLPAPATATTATTTSATTGACTPVLVPAPAPASVLVLSAPPAASAGPVAPRAAWGTHHAADCTDGTTPLLRKHDEDCTPDASGNSTGTSSAAAAAGSSWESFGAQPQRPGWGRSPQRQGESQEELDASCPCGCQCPAEGAGGAAPCPVAATLEIPPVGLPSVMPHVPSYGMLYGGYGSQDGGAYGLGDDLLPEVPTFAPGTCSLGSEERRGLLCLPSSSVAASGSAGAGGIVGTEAAGTALPSKTTALGVPSTRSSYSILADASAAGAGGSVGPGLHRACSGPARGDSGMVVVSLRDDAEGRGGRATPLRSSSGKVLLSRGASRGSLASLASAGGGGGGGVAGADGGGSYLQRLRQLLSSGVVWMFLAKCFLLGFGCGIMSTFLFIYISALGATHLLLGLMLTVNCVAEVPVFHLQSAIMQRLSTDAILNTAVLTLAGRLALYAALPVLPGAPWNVLPVELLQGVTFALSWGACTTHCKRIAPRELQATMQGLMQSVYWGVAGGLGGIVGALLHEQLGGQRMFVTGALLIVCGWAIVASAEALAAWAARRRGGRRGAGAGAGTGAGAERRRARAADEEVAALVGGVECSGGKWGGAGGEGGGKQGRERGAGAAEVHASYGFWWRWPTARRPGRQVERQQSVASDTSFSRDQSEQP